MVRIPPQGFGDEEGKWDDAKGAEDFRPLTAAEVQNLRLQQPLLSIWRVVLAQVLVGLAVAALTWLFTGLVSAAWSAASDVYKRQILEMLQMVANVFTGAGSICS